MKFKNYKKAIKKAGVNIQEKRGTGYNKQDWEGKYFESGELEEYFAPRFLISQRVETMVVDFLATIDGLCELNEFYHINKKEIQK